MNSDFPKILIAAPTAAAKNYCFGEWITNVMNFKYPNFDIVLFDNTPDGGANAMGLNSAFKQMYGAANNQFSCINSLQLRNNPDIPSTIERMAMSTNDCRNTFLNNPYYKWLSLETDVMPEATVIEDLLSHDKKVIGVPYYRDEGRYRRLCIQTLIKSSPTSGIAFNMEVGEDVYFLDGTLKKVSSCGLGCVLIDRSVAEQIEFRFEAGVDVHPDSLWAEDCYTKNIPIFCDTAQLARHENKNWGAYGIDYH